MMLLTWLRLRRPRKTVADVVAPFGAMMEELNGIVERMRDENDEIERAVKDLLNQKKGNMGEVYSAIRIRAILQDLVEVEEGD